MDISFLLDWPSALRQSHNLIRSTRNPSYFKMADYFATLWGKTLEIGGQVALLSGSNMAALDKLFEQAPSTEALQRLYETLQQNTDRQSAAAYTGLYTQKMPQNLEEAIALHIAFLTIKGYERIATINETVAQMWLDLWQRKVDQQNQQQLEHSSLCLTYTQSYPSSDKNFDEAVETYLEMFGETSALSVAIIGALPFSSFIRGELLSAISPLLDQLSPLFRFAQDVRIDLDEKLNLGIYIAASERRLSFHVARHQLATGLISRTELERQLKKLWEFRSTRAQLMCEKSLDPYRSSPIGNCLESLCQALLAVAQRLTGEWKS